jgi:hypothetical protein
LPRPPPGEGHEYNRPSENAAVGSELIARVSDRAFSANLTNRRRRRKDALTFGGL